MADDKVSNWVALQKKVWSVDEGLRAELITLESPSGDAIASWPVDLENLGDVINQTIELQSSELPKGAHRFRLVAYADRTRKNQLNELPQTIRGRSGDASAAHAEAIAMQRATAMAVANLENTLNITLRLNEELEKRLNERTEDFSLAYNRWIEANGENFDQKIRWNESEAKNRRSEQLLEMLTPLVTMGIAKFGPMLMRMGPSDLATMQKFLENPFKATEPSPAAPATPPAAVEPEVINNVERPTVEPDHSPVPGVPKSGQASVPLNDQRGRARNSKRPTPQRRGTPPRGTAKTKGRKRQ